MKSLTNSAHLGTRLIATVLATLLATATVGYLSVRHTLARYDEEETLRPTLALLAANRHIVDNLAKSSELSSTQGVLAYYLQRIRVDGLPRHSAMRQQIDQVVNNNTAIVTLLSKYTPRARHAELRVTASQYADYAASLRDRWQSVFELFMGGGTLPVQQPEPPKDIEAAIQLELRLSTGVEF